jgi:hypothetical protein
MANPNDPTVANFFEVFTPGDIHFGDTTWLMNSFCADAGPAAHPTRPTVGIASAAGGASLGPQFEGQTKIKGLFDQLFMSFPNLQYATSPPSCYSGDQNTIIVQTLLTTGGYTQPWFPGTHPAYSKPLSDIEASGKSSKVPACAVFSFNPTATGDNTIVRLAIYMDRWQLSVDLWPGTPQPRYSRRPFPAP